MSRRGPSPSYPTSITRGSKFLRSYPLQSDGVPKTRHPISSPVTSVKANGDDFSSYGQEPSILRLPVNPLRVRVPIFVPPILSLFLKV